MMNFSSPLASIVFRERSRRVCYETSPQHRTFMNYAIIAKREVIIGDEIYERRGEANKSNNK